MSHVHVSTKPNLVMPIWIAVSESVSADQARELGNQIIDEYLAGPDCCNLDSNVLADHREFLGNVLEDSIQEHHPNAE